VNPGVRRFAGWPLISASIALAALAAAVGFYFKWHQSEMTPAPPPSATRGPSSDDRTQLMSKQIADLQRELAAVRAQMADQSHSPAAPAIPANDPKPPQSGLGADDARAIRAADVEQHRVYMTGVAQAFAMEKIDVTWAARATSRVNAALHDHEALRGIAHDVECHTQTCRVKIEDDGSRTLDTHLPMLALSLVDVLPAISAERVDQGNGRSALVLYMSSQRQPPVAAPK
jgi:hypothetical protein